MSRLSQWQGAYSKFQTE